MATLKFIFHFFYIQSVKQHLFPCFLKAKPHSKIASGCSAWSVSTYYISLWSVEKCVRKWSQEVLLRADLAAPRQGHILIQWKWYKMVEVKCAYNYMAGMKKNCWKVCVWYPTLTLNFLVEWWTVYKPRPTPLKEMTEFCFKNADVNLAFAIANRGWEVHCLSSECVEKKLCKV